MTIQQAIPQAFQFTKADRLGKALDAAGISNNEMAEYLGVSRNTISNYISGRTDPKREVMLLWAMRTGAPLAWLETGDWPSIDDPNIQLSDYKPVTSLSGYRAQVAARKAS